MKLVEVLTARAETGTAIDVLYEKDVFIADSGASSHSTFTKEGASEEKQDQTATIGHSGEAVESTSTLTLKGQFVDKRGNRGISATLDDVKYNPTYNFNLLSLTKMMAKGWKVEGTEDMFIASKDGQVIKFDIKVHTATGTIYACRYVRNTDISAASTAHGTTMNIQKAHELLGHSNEDATREMAKQLGWSITRGKLKPCIYCALAKAKQKKVKKKSSKKKAEVAGERIYYDVSKVTVRHENGSEYDVPNKWWGIIVDEATGKKFALYTKTKKGQVEPMCEWIHKMNSRGIRIKCIRMDPGGENVKLKSRAESVDWHPLQPLEFELTSRNTPQHNHLAEVAFPYLSGKAKAMMGSAHIPNNERGKIVLHAIKCAIQLDGLRLVNVGGKVATRNEHVYGHNPGWANNMRTFGECGVVKEGKNGKAGNRGQAMMFVGYAEEREADSYIMYNPKTQQTVTTRDVIWMKRMYYQQSNDFVNQCNAQDQDDSSNEDDHSDTSGDFIMHMTPTSPTSPANNTNVDQQSNDHANNADDNIAPANETHEDDEAQNNNDDSEVREGINNVPPESRTTRSGRASKSAPRLIETMTAVDVHYLQAMNDMCPMDVMGVGAGVGGGFAHTTELHVLNYKQAMASKDREDWIKEVRNEKRRFDKYNAFTAKKRSEVPQGVKIMSTVWAMKKKSNGKLRGRLNLRGFQQRDGEHYISSSISSPVTNATTVRIALTLLALCPEWIAIVVDIEGAFLQGEFTDGEEIYIDVPEGFEEYYDDDTVLLLNVPIYGTKQGASCFYKKLVKTVKGRLYKRSQADPCLYYTWRNGRLVMMISWIDDNMILGHPEDVAQFRKDLEDGFECKYEGTLTEYVGSKIDIRRKSAGTSIKVTQPVLVQSLEDEFDLPTGKAPRTPVPAGQVLVKKDDGVNLDKRDTTKYRSGVAKMMFLMQWSRPECQNPVRGMARQMAQPQEHHYKAMISCMKYITSTKDRGLMIQPRGRWNGRSGFKFRIHGRSDSDYAANTEDRRSISGGRTFLNEAPVMFRSSTQRFVTLSVTEAETAAGVMVAQDMMYVYRLLTSMDLEVELPMVLEMDNKGAVDLANNWSVGGRTRHVDVRNFYLREMKDEGLLLIRHVPGEDNDADIFTKNTAYATFNKHVKKFVGDDEYTDQFQTPE